MVIGVCLKISADAPFVALLTLHSVSCLAQPVYAVLIINIRASVTCMLARYIRTKKYVFLEKSKM